MALTRRRCLEGLTGLGLLGAAVLEPLRPALRRMIAAMASLRGAGETLAAHEAVPALAHGAGGTAGPSSATSVAALLPAQLRAARRLLGWSEEQTARASGVSRTVLRALERGAGSPPSSIPSGKDDEACLCAAQRLRATFEAAGVVFLGSALEGPGVRLAAGRRVGGAPIPSPVTALCQNEAQQN